jgi:hypothetical protein
MVTVLTYPAFADVEKIATTCEQQICFHWWPKLPKIEGWQHDRQSSIHYNFNALAPTGKLFTDSEAVIYANAVYRPRGPNEKTLASFIESDISQFREDTPGLVVDEEKPLMTGDGQQVLVFRLKPSQTGQWERVAYFEEGDYYMVFVLSSRSERGLSSASPAYEILLLRYRAKL